MPVPWFDIPQNNAGTLTARLSVDAEQVNSLTTTIIYIKIQNLSTVKPTLNLHILALNESVS